jgi:flagellar L-ring protein precursor FlgH
MPAMLCQHRLIAIVGVAVAMASASARGQNSSLFTQELPSTAGPALTLEDTSWLYQPVEPPRVIKKYDTITIIVDEKSQVTSTANVERRKQAQLNAQLKDWVKFDGLDLVPDPQSQGDQKVNGTLQGQFRAQSNLDTRDALKFRIAATVADIRPNGHLVLEAHKKIRNNDEHWDVSISGIVDPQDVLPNRTVLSEDVTELHVDKDERGHVRDGYRRGWLYKLIDKYGFF